MYDKVTAIHNEIQQTRFKIQQLNENAEKEEMKAKVSCMVSLAVCFCFFFMEKKQKSWRVISRRWQSAFSISFYLFIAEVPSALGGQG